MVQSSTDLTPSSSHGPEQHRPHMVQSSTDLTHWGPAEQTSRGGPAEVDQQRQSSRGRPAEADQQNLISSSYITVT
uniref:Uncharacterized protein n=1 Tax=Knipowitschia caucasica TaxID=637954 RepID=A0AAV2KWR6_KNICA